MDRINKILHNGKYTLLLRRIEENEKNRKFCRHGINHLLDVARIAYIMNLEQKLDISKELIYAAALLHDIGRAGEDVIEKKHHELSCIYAGDILSEAGFDEKEADMIINAIKVHNDDEINKTGLAFLLYRADKLSRRCFECDVYDECYWNAETKNDILYY